jgi:endonuclease/exonuclease/phosphatase family metal-dependent hydrolase
MKTTRLFALLPLLALLGCPAGDEPLTLVTYNAGLAVGFVPGAQERAAGTSDAIAALDADVVCLQEVWDADHVALVEAAAGDAYPYSYFPDPAQETGAEGACTETDLDPLLECMADECGDACTDELPGCLLEQCAFQFLGLEKNCMRCVQANVGATVETIGGICTTETTEFAYEGSFGTGILSTHPIEVTDHVFESTTNRRSVLHALVAAPGGDVDLFCTHLTAVFSIVPYPREEGSWEDEQAVQIDAMRAWVDEVATGDRVALLGDMNTGPAAGTNDAELPVHYETLADGYANPYAESDQRCTFCPDNGLSSVDSDERGRLIDHVLLRGFDGDFEATRVLDETVDVESCGEPMTGAHSDHYGVQVTIQPE